MRRSAYLLLLAGTLLSPRVFAQPAQPEPGAPAAGSGSAAAPTAPAAPAASGEPPAAAQPPAKEQPPAAPAEGATPAANGKPEAGKAPAKKDKAAAPDAKASKPEWMQKPQEFHLPGHWVSRHVFPEERYPDVDPNDPWAAKFAVHGYFRAPLRITVKERDNPAEGQAASDVRSPWLVDDDYNLSGFAYTPVNETDYSEMYFMVGNQLVTGNVALMSSLFSDSARVMLDQQLGISQAWVTFRGELDLDPVTIRLRAKAGSFWDRFGWQPKYDTYLFGRTHQIGGQVDAEVDVWDLTFGLTMGIGAHRENIESNQGFTPIGYIRFRAAYDGIVELGLQYISTWAHDERQLSEIKDGKIDIFGVDLRVDSRYAGKLYGALGALNADHSSFLSPSLEVMHSNGGRGLTENYFGTASSDDGTGDMWNVGAEYDYSVADTLNAVDPTLSFPLDGDVTLSAFMMYSFVNSDQVSNDPTVNRDNRGYFKQGLELSYWIFPWIGISGRYDRVVPDLEDSPSSFRIYSPRLSLRGKVLGGEALLFYQFAHYDYGDRVALRAGQVPNETLPDVDVHKIQGQMSF